MQGINSDGTILAIKTSRLLSMSKKHVIEIIAPSSGTPDNTVPQDAVSYLEEQGFELRIPNDLFSKESLIYEANTAEYRLAHFLKAANDDSVDTIMALRGGYSAAKWVHMLASHDLPKEKFVVGFSDVTALLLVLHQQFDWKCVHGMGLGQLPNKITKESIDATLGIITGATTSMDIPGLILMNNIDTPIYGTLTGGNLSILQTSIGTSWQIDCSGKIVFIEDVNEPGYKIDRMFEHLIQSGTLDGAKAIVLGDFSRNTGEIDTVTQHALTLFATRMEDQNCAVLKVNKAFGHGENNTPLVLGSDAYIEAASDGSFSMHYSW